MLIEHTFVTTLNANQTMEAATELLAQGGFVRGGDACGFPLDHQAWSSLEVQRGAKRAYDATACPQTVRLNWDRGRVSVGASIEPALRTRWAWCGGLLSGLLNISAGSFGNGRRRTQVIELMTAICQALELRLVAGAAPEEARAQWLKREAEIRKAARQQRIYGRFAVVGVLGLVSLLAVTMSRATTNFQTPSKTVVYVNRTYPVRPAPVFFPPHVHIGRHRP